MVTIYDIAKAAGVTATTVSNVLKGKGSVSVATRARVLQYVQDLGYQPNLVARSLIKGHTDMIGLVVPSMENPFFAEITTVVERLAYAADLRILVNTLSSDDEPGRRMLNDLALRRVDGILMAPGSYPPGIINLVEALHLPAVYCLPEGDNDVLSASVVYFDFAQGGQLAAEHLISLGHRRMGILDAEVSEDGRSGHYVRVDGFKKVAREHGLEILSRHILAGADRLDEGKAAGYRLLTLPDRPTAVFATNDMMAIGLLSAAWELGLHVPQDLSVVGFDDVPLGKYLTPPLTTVVIDKVAIMAKAVEMLMHVIKGQEALAPPVYPARLAVRGSTGPLIS